MKLYKHSVVAAKLNDASTHISNTCCDVSNVLIF